MSFLIHVQHEDDLLAVVDRVLMAQDDEVALVVPEGARLFASEENLSLLRREAEAGGKRVVLKTADPRGRTFAARSGIPVQAAQSPRAKRVFSDIVAPGTLPETPQMPPAKKAAPPPESAALSGDEASPSAEEREPEPEPSDPGDSSRTEPGEPEGESDESEKEFPEHLAAVVGGSGYAAHEAAEDAAAAGAGTEGVQDPEQAPPPSEPPAGPSQPGQGALPLEGVPEEPLPFLSSAPDSQKKTRSGFAFSGFSLSGILGGRAGAAAIMLLGIAVAFLVANEVLPSVEVRIQPKSEIITFTMPASVVVGDAAQGDVAGQRVQVSATEEQVVEASGEAEVTERASGTLTITNAYSSDSQTLVATTRFVSQSGKLFRLDNTIVVPGAEIEDGEIVPSSIDATVTADEPGPDYNIGPSTFSIPGFQGSPKYNKFTARSDDAMKGGASGVVRVVTAEDIQKAREGIETALTQRLEAEFAAQVLPGLIVADDAKDLTMNVSVDAEADAPQDRVTATAEGTLSAIAYRGDDLEGYVLEVLGERIPADTDVVEGSTTITPTIVEINNEAGTVAMDVAVETKAAWRVDEQLVKEAIAGRDETEIRTWLTTYDAIERARAVFRPFWVTAAPENPDQIRVSVGLDAI